MLYYSFCGSPQGSCVSLWFLSVGLFHDLALSSLVSCCFSCCEFRDYIYTHIFNFHLYVNNTYILRLQSWPSELQYPTPWFWWNISTWLLTNTSAYLVSKNVCAILPGSSSWHLYLSITPQLSFQHSPGVPISVRMATFLPHPGLRISGYLLCPCNEC